MQTLKKAKSGKHIVYLVLFLSVNDAALQYTCLYLFQSPWDPVLPGKFLFDVCLISHFICIYMD